MFTVYIGIGSNIGKKEDNCRNAITFLREKGLEIVSQSSIIETEPWGVKNQPRFMNAAVEAKTILQPGELLKLLKEIEREMGRRSGTRWGPRVIDMDILFYDDLVMRTQDLEIPHPGIQDRDFVLKPLAEIAPDKVHPVLKKSIRELLDNIAG